MKVQESLVEMRSHCAEHERYALQESLRIWVGDGDPSSNEADRHQPVLQIQDRFTLSQRCSTEESTGCRQKGLGGKEIKNEIIRLLLEKLTGRRIKIITLSGLGPRSGAEGMETCGKTRTGGGDSLGFGLAYDRYESYHETETLEFVSRGVLLTEEGREIRFELQFGMERVFATSEYSAIRLGDAQKMDPLVVNLNGQQAMLTDATFMFDIDSDGVDERLAALGPGKGFLAMDRDGDGRITDGTELFGPRLGDGFLELAGLDKDGNGWVDENEPGFRTLGLWSKDPQGNESFLPMEESGIGAIYTGRIASPFSIKDALNELQAEVKETGVYLTENGLAGAIHELDMVI
jgi:hypothetical protein